MGSRPTVEGPEDLEPAEPDQAEDDGIGVGSVLGNAPLHRAKLAPTVGQPVHRATTQMLPGRLQPLNAEEVEQEIRFLQGTIPRHTFTVTLGWKLGAPPDHVTLDHPSVKALHAKMTYQNSRWMIETLQDTDPVEINETMRLEVGVPYILCDGDKIRIGKALFRFVYP